MLLSLVLALFVGAIVGLASAFLGIGGGLVIVPLLPLIADVSASETIGTSLLVVACVAGYNVWSFQRRKLVDWKAAVPISIASALGAFIAGRLVPYTPVMYLHTGFMALLLLLSFMIFRNVRRAHRREALRAQEAHESHASLPLLGGLGFVNGVASGFTGIGGGVFVVPMLSMLGWVESKKIVPTSVATIVITAGAGALALFFGPGSAPVGGSVEVKSLLRVDLGLSLFVGATLASTWAVRHRDFVTSRKRDWLIASLLLVLSIRTIFVIIRAMNE